MRNQFCKELAPEIASRLVYICNLKIVGTDDDLFKEQVFEANNPSFGLVFNSEFPEIGNHCYGIGLVSEDISENRRGNSYLAVLLSDKTDNPKKLIIDGTQEVKEKDDYWGEYWVYTDHVDQNKIDTILMDWIKVMNLPKNKQLKFSVQNN